MRILKEKSLKVKEKARRPKLVITKQYIGMIRIVIILILFLTEYKTQNILYGFIWLNLISNIIEYIHSTWELRNIDIIYTYILANGRKKELCVREKMVCDIISAMIVIALNIFLFMYYKEGYFLFYTIPTLFSVLSRYTKNMVLKLKKIKSEIGI